MITDMVNWDALPMIQLENMRRRIYTGKNVMLVRNLIDAHAVVPAHSHPHEQMLWVISGSCRCEIQGKACEMGPNDVVLIPGGAEHKVTVLGDEILDAVDIFSPIREDFI